MRFSDVGVLIGQCGIDPTWPVLPGPFDPRIPVAHVLVAGYGGPGEDLEGLVDRSAWQVRVVGPQNDFDTAEDAALKIDRGLLGIHSGRLYTGGPWVVGCSRVGGAPNPLLRDTADRTHFICSYIIEHQMALAN